MSVVLASQPANNHWLGGINPPTSATTMPVRPLRRQSSMAPSRVIQTRADHNCRTLGATTGLEEGRVPDADSLPLAELGLDGTNDQTMTLEWDSASAPPRRAATTSPI
jgi:hypothetical protein